MSLFGALRSGVTGIAAQSNAMSQISDNIANVNTVGYKRAATRFSAFVNAQSSDIAYNAGGVRSSVVRENRQQGMLQTTQFASDLGIAGEGFFVVSDELRKIDDGTYMPTGNIFYTRSGQFRSDHDGNLRNAEGFYLLGWQRSEDNTAFIETNMVSQFRSINVRNKFQNPIETTFAALSANLNASSEGGYTNSFTASIEVYDKSGHPYQLGLRFERARSADGSVYTDPEGFSEWHVIASVTDERGQNVGSFFNPGSITQAEGVETYDPTNPRGEVQVATIRFDKAGNLVSVEEPDEPQAFLGDFNFDLDGDGDADGIDVVGNGKDALRYSLTRYYGATAAAAGANVILQNLEKTNIGPNPDAGRADALLYRYNPVYGISPGNPALVVGIPPTGGTGTPTIINSAGTNPEPGTAVTIYTFGTGTTPIAIIAGTAVDTDGDQVSDAVRLDFDLDTNNDGNFNTISANNIIFDANDNPLATNADGVRPAGIDYSGTLHNSNTNIGTGLLTVPVANGQLALQSASRTLQNSNDGARRVEMFQLPINRNGDLSQAIEGVASFAYNEAGMYFEFFRANAAGTGIEAFLRIPGYAADSNGDSYLDTAILFGRLLNPDGTRVADNTDVELDISVLVNGVATNQTLTLSQNGTTLERNRAGTALANPVDAPALVDNTDYDFLGSQLQLVSSGTDPDTNPDQLGLALTSISELTLLNHRNVRMYAVSDGRELTGQGPVNVTRNWPLAVNIDLDGDGTLDIHNAQLIDRDGDGFGDTLIRVPFIVDIENPGAEPILSLATDASKIGPEDANGNPAARMFNTLTGTTYNRMVRFGIDFDNDYDTRGEDSDRTILTVDLGSQFNPATERGGQDGLSQFHINGQVNGAVNHIEQNGRAYAMLRDVSYAKDGVVEANYDNGEQQSIAQVALMTFANPDGLVAHAGSVFSASRNAGSALARVPGMDGAGQIQSATIESSTVDLAEEFSNMIVTQQAYSASTQVITKADELLQELVRSIR